MNNFNIDDDVVVCLKGKIVEMRTDPSGKVKYLISGENFQSASVFEKNICAEKIIKTVDNT
jgi:hypothetical protein